MKEQSGRVRKPNALLYELALAGFRIYNKFAYHLHITRNEAKGLKAPFVFLNNHPSNRDVVGAALAAYPHRVNCVGGFFLFCGPVQSWAFNQVGVIPKSQFAPDISSVKKMISCARNERVLMLFPEGQISPAGRQSALPPGLGKLLRTMGVPVVMNTLHGAYLSTPKWADCKRKRYVEADCRIILTEEQIRSMSPAEIEQTVERELAYNDYDWQRERMIPYKSKEPALGLQKLCYKCPRCGAEFTMDTRGAEIICSACGNTGVMDEYGFLHPKGKEDVIPDTPLDWHDWQRAQLQKEIEKPDFLMTSPCTLWFSEKPGDKKAAAGTGQVTMTRDGIVYEGAFFGKPFTLSGKAAAVIGLPFSAGKTFEIPCGTQFYQIEPENKRIIMKWVDAMDLVHRAALSGKEKRNNE